MITVKSVVFPSNTVMQSYYGAIVFEYNYNTDYTSTPSYIQAKYFLERVNNIKAKKH